MFSFANAFKNPILGGTTHFIDDRGSRPLSFLKLVLKRTQLLFIVRPPQSFPYCPARLRQYKTTSVALVTENPMGSLDNAVMTGFICRLCSEMSRLVFHIYGEEGERMQLAKKINEYLPINVHFDDPLPKTVCSQCVRKLECQHELIKKCRKANFGFHGRVQPVSNNC